MTAAVMTEKVRPRILSIPQEPDAATVSVAEAAQLCGVSDDTIRRRLHQNLLAGAFQEGHSESAPWRIPVASLVEAGLCEPEVLDELDLRLNPNISRLSNQLVETRAELLTERTRREAAESAFMSAKEEVGYLRNTVDRLLGIAGLSNERKSN